jgi:GTPase SAR1 family protein
MYLNRIGSYDMLSDFLRMIKGFVLFIGPSAAGKTSILRRLVTGKFEEQEPTFGFWEENISKIRIIEIGGQASLREYWQVALEQQPIRIFFVIDVTIESDYSDYKNFLTENSEKYSHLTDITTLIVNKIDLHNSFVEFEENGYIIKCSAKTGEGMLDILEMISSLEINIDSSTPTQVEQKSDMKKGTTKKIRDEQKAESLLKEFQGKF